MARVNSKSSRKVRLSVVAGVFALLVITAACESTRTVSLKEAERISSKFQDLSLRIPTRGRHSGV